MSELKVAVVGGGIGGLVLALALRERGISFEVYEQAGELREIGAAVALSGNGTRELRRLGVGDHLEAVSVVPSALVIRRWDTGEVLADHPIGRDGAYEAAFGAPYYGVHRVALLQALAQRLGGDGLNLARRCVGIDERRSGVELQFADGRMPRPISLSAPTACILSSARMSRGVRGRFSGTVGYRGLVAVEACPASRSDAASVLGRSGRHLLHYAIDGGRTVNFLAVVRVSEWTNEAWMEQCAAGDAVDASRAGTPP